ncbi:class C sortase, partial [Lactobacillus mulieris]|nr:class C sortase [Lactobacillus mulieris]
MKIYRNEPPKKKKIDWLYYLLWFVICFGIVAASTYPFVSDFVLAQKQKAQIEQFNKTDRTQ